LAIPWPSRHAFQTHHRYVSTVWWGQGGKISLKAYKLPDRSCFTTTAVRGSLAKRETMRHWLFKSEPNTYSIDDLAGHPDHTTMWEGVRNYQARNFLRDDVKQGDRVLFYHSACKHPAVVGTAVVTRDGYPDPHAFDPRSNYFDDKSDPRKPTWYAVDIRLERKLPRPVTLTELRGRADLASMVLLQKGSRLSIQPLTKKEFETVVKLAAKRPNG
jgi:predicted RNA-binding protein with PUA-like domain